MDRNQIIGFILIFATLLIWTMTSSPSKEELEQRKRYQDSIAQLELAVDHVGDSLKIAQINAVENNPVEMSDSIKNLMLQSKFGLFATAAAGESETFVLENNEVKLTFNSKGGVITEALIKDHFVVHENEKHEEFKTQLYLLNNVKNKWEFDINTGLGNSKIKSSDLYFSGIQNGNTIEFTAKNQTGTTIVQKYSLADEGYGVNYEIGTNNASQLFDENKLSFYWENHLNSLEKNKQFEQRYSTIYYKEYEENPDYCNCVSDDKEEMGSNNLDWISHSNQFFNTSLLPKDGNKFENAILETVMTDLKESEDLKILKSNMSLSFENSNTYAMDLFIGPNEYERLVKFDKELEHIIPFGNSIFGSINRYIVRPFFNFLSNFIGSKGVVIILLIFIIKMLLYPLLYKMLHSQAKMGALKPEIAKLKDKNKDDAQKTQMETMKLYREYGVSPFGGCMPMILQMPIWYALFRFFPASITFRQEPFLWATDLSSYDVLTYLPFEIPFMGSHISLFTILWAISTILYTYYNMQNMDLSANPAMKYMQYLMPVMFLAFFNNYASGLTCYMFFSNMINVIQTILTKTFVFDDDKIKAELDLQRAKPKKKSGFSTRLEEALKQQQQAQAKKQAKPKKK
jgi:YidC/Oxa1 family membrane protein insertase